MTRMTTSRFDGLSIIGESKAGVNRFARRFKSGRLSIHVHFARLNAIDSKY